MLSKSKMKQVGQPHERLLFILESDFGAPAGLPDGRSGRDQLELDVFIPTNRAFRRLGQRFSDKVFRVGFEPGDEADLLSK